MGVQELRSNIERRKALAATKWSAMESRIKFHNERNPTIAGVASLDSILQNLRTKGRPLAPQLAKPGASVGNFNFSSRSRELVKPS